MKRMVFAAVGLMMVTACSRSEKKEDSPSKAEQKLETIIDAQQPASSYAEAKVPQEFAVPTMQAKACTPEDLVKVNAVLEDTKDQMDKAEKEIDAGILDMGNRNNAGLKSHMGSAKAHFENIEKWCGETLSSIDAKNCGIMEVRVSLDGVEMYCSRVKTTKSKINLILSRIPAN